MSHFPLLCSSSTPHQMTKPLLNVLVFYLHHFKSITFLFESDFYAHTHTHTHTHRHTHTLTLSSMGIPVIPQLFVHISDIAHIMLCFIHSAYMFESFTCWAMLRYQGFSHASRHKIPHSQSLHSSQGETDGKMVKYRACQMAISDMEKNNAGKMAG